MLRPVNFVWGIKEQSRALRSVLRPHRQEMLVESFRFGLCSVSSSVRLSLSLCQSLCRWVCRISITKRCNESYLLGHFRCGQQGGKKSVRSPASLSSNGKFALHTHSTYIAHTHTHIHLHSHIKVRPCVSLTAMCFVRGIPA